MVIKDSTIEIETCHNSEKGDGFLGVGFFSSATSRLQLIINYFNTFKNVPKIVNSFDNFKAYKDNLSIDLCSILFKTLDNNIEYYEHVNFNYTFSSCNIKKNKL